MRFSEKHKDDVIANFILKYLKIICYWFIDNLKDLEPKKKYYEAIENNINKYEVEYVTVIYMVSLQFLLWGWIFGLNFWGNCIAATIGYYLRMWIYKKFNR